ncbi:MAG: OmpA family protein [Bacteroidia bacterium]|nr:OmpA family protein [Bacteroidia bacterium]
MKLYKLIPGMILLSLVSCNTGQIKSLEKNITDKELQIQDLQEQVEYHQLTNSSLLDRLADLSVINKNDAESIKNSLIGLNTQFDYITSLSDEIKQKDSLNTVLANQLKSSLIDINDNDIQIKVKGSAVYVSLSDNMLFKSASATINKSAYSVLEKVARILNDNSELNVLVEGHTDNVPIANNNYKDNWDLSVIRATSVVRLLQETFSVAPERLTAAGKADYNPKNENKTVEGRRHNRRTEIIITPKLDQFFELLSAKELMS